MGSLMCELMIEHIRQDKTEDDDDDNDDDNNMTSMKMIGDRRAVTKNAD